MLSLFQRLLNEGEQLLQELVDAGQQESVELEFKTKKDASTGEVARDDQQNLGILLSAFSNSAGGLAIWGVEARRSSDNIDCAVALRPISRVERFKSDMIRLAAQALQPKHDGVRIEAIPSLQSEGSGFLAIFVERSERRPHRCEFKDVKQYYKRSLDTSVAMEHFDIEDSFKRQVVPWVDVGYEIVDGGRRNSANGSIVFRKINMFLYNPSPVSAQFPYLVIPCAFGCTIPTISTTGGLPHRMEGSTLHIEGGADVVIHPDQRRSVTSLVTEIPASFIAAQAKIKSDDVPTVSITCRFGCLNSRVGEKQLIIDPYELMGRPANI